MTHHEPSKKIVTRFAPSPTGNLHVGGFRTALFNYLYSRHNDGKLILRIEDTDKERSKPEYEKNILDGLAWLGLSFDETYRQSERNDIHASYLSKMISEGKAYVSKEDPNADTTAFKSEKGAQAAAAATVAGTRRDTVIRFKNPNKVISFYDLIRGEITFDTTELGDFVIAKSADEPLYNFAVVVDDHDMGVTHVIRGEDHISNTPRQIMIGEAIGATKPVYAHIPLILSPDKSKLSKRKGAKSLIEYREMGYLPQALTNFMALLGWNPGTNEELFSLDELVKRFNIEQVQKSGAVYNEEKLRWVNKEYLKRTPHVEIARAVVPFFTNSQRFIEKKWKLSDELVASLVPVILDRISVYGDITAMVDAGDFDYFFETPEYDFKDLIWRDDTGTEKTKSHLEKAFSWLEKLSDDDYADPEKIKAVFWNYATEEGRGSVLWPIRFALSGKMKSPDPFTLISILGKKESIKRLKHAHSHVHA
jgi:glutamyl-tRNA synthetase